MTYSRILLADSLDKTFFWLDVDALLLPGWDKLLDFPEPSGDIVIRAAIEDGNQQRAPTKNQAKLRAGENYFNTGVAQINPSAWRRKGFNKKWIELLDEYELRGFEFVDQCILNYLLFDSNQTLPSEFNFSSKSKNPSPSQPKIIHYVGSHKPWTVPTLERNTLVRSFLKLSGVDFFKMWWAMEHEVLVAADGHSKGLAGKLRLLRKSQVLPPVSSLTRLVSVLMTSVSNYFQKQW